MNDKTTLDVLHRARPDSDSERAGWNTRDEVRERLITETQADQPQPTVLRPTGTQRLSAKPWRVAVPIGIAAAGVAAALIAVPGIVRSGSDSNPGVAASQAVVSTQPTTQPSATKQSKPSVRPSSTIRSSTAKPVPLGKAALVGQLAAAAAGQPPVTMPADGYVHTITVEAQSDTPGSRRLESWTDADGRTWRHDTEADGTENYLQFDDHMTRSDFGELKSLPTDPATLERYLRSRVQANENGQDGVLFKEIGELVRTAVMPPAQRSAAVKVLGRIPGVQITRTGATVTASLHTANGTSALTFDAGSSALTGSSLVGGGISFTEKVVLNTVSATLPAAVRAKAVHQN